MRICTFTLDFGETIQAITEEEFKDNLHILNDADEYVWQDNVLNKEVAIANHEVAFIKCIKWKE